MNALHFALITSLCFGIAGPIAKLGFMKGLHTDGFALAYLLGLAPFIIFTFIKKGIGTFYPTPEALIFGLVAGILCGVGFKANSIALAAPASLVSVVVMLAASYPILTVFISVPLFNEWEKVITWKLVLGSIFVIVGGILVSTSTKAQLP